MALLPALVHLVLLLAPTPNAAAGSPAASGGGTAVEARAELGRHLFYDPRLSVNGTTSCATCHRQELAFTDGLGRAVGATGEVHPRGAMSLANVGDFEVRGGTLGWDDPNLLSLEAQALVPLLGEHPIEMGLRGHEVAALKRLRDEPRYPPLFRAAFPTDLDPFTLGRVVEALSAFQRTLASKGSPYDRWLHDDEPLRPDARSGMRLFFSPRLACSRCHTGPHFAGKPGEFFNTGLYDVDHEGAYPAGSEGVFRHTREPDDMGRFRAPTLRNVAVTAPYMHDGSVATLEEAVTLYARGGRTGSPLKDELLRGFELTPEESADLVAFLRSLTDEAFLVDRRFGDPWTN